jgi:hypothetical protein
MRRNAILQRILPHLIILFAFGLHLVYLAEIRQAFPDRFTVEPFCGVDAVAHLQRADGLLAGTLPGQDTFYFIPFYPLYLAGLKGLVGDSLLAPLLIQALVQTVGLAALYGLGRLLFSPFTGMLAALGLATYSYYLFYGPCFDQALFTAPFLTLGLFFLVKYDSRRHNGAILGAGLALAIAVLSRPTTLAVLPVVVIWLFWYRQSLPQFGRAVALLVLPVIILIAPITWHNYRASGRFVLLSDNFGVNLFTGNNPAASGLDSLAHAQSQPAVLHFLAVRARVIERHETTYAAEVLSYLREQPADALALTLRKTWLWFGETEEPLLEPFFPLTVVQARTLAFWPLRWQALAIVALLGMVLGRASSWSRLSLVWLVYGVFSLTTILFFIQFRFRLPFVPFVMLSAASLLARAPGWSRRDPRRFWAVLIVLLLLLPIVPGLSIFILLLVGLGWWPRRAQAGQTRFFWTAGAVVVYVLLIGSWSRANALASDVSQTIDHYLGPPLAGSGILGQTFQMDCNGLNRIDLTLGRLTNQHDQAITFYLATDPTAQDILYETTFDGGAVVDYQQRSFSFAPIPDSAGRTFFFFIASPASTPDNAITARGYGDTPIDYYPNGAAWAGQPGALQPLQADFAFGAYCDLGAWQKWRAVFASY